MSRSIYQNLDTAFVNIPALLRYLCKRGFVGQVHVEMTAYEADILLSGDNQIEVREKDHITGRVADGEEAMQRLLIRVREAGGIINVNQRERFETVEELPTGLRPEPQIPVAQLRQEIQTETPPMEIDVEGISNENAPQQSVFSELVSETRDEAAGNDVAELNEDEWNHLLKLMVDLLASIDRTLQTAGLQFDAAFTKASSELAEDYPFLRHVSYKGGILTVGARPTAPTFVTGTMEVLRRLMTRLGSDSRFTELHRHTVEKLIDLAHNNKETYDRYAVTTPLYRVLGVNTYNPY